MMSSNIQDPFSGLVLDTEEQTIEDALERGEYVDALDFNNSKDVIEDAARRYLKLNTTKPVTLRIKQKDLIKIKAKAKRNGMPYQTLLSVLLHNFAEDTRELLVK